MMVWLSSLCRMTRILTYRLMTAVRMEGRGSAAGLVEVWRRSAGLVEVWRGTAAGLVEVWRSSAAGLVEVWWGTAKVLRPSLMVPLGLRHPPGQYRLLEVNFLLQFPQLICKATTITALDWLGWSW